MIGWEQAKVSICPALQINFYNVPNLMLKSRVLENLESPGKGVLVLESAGNFV